MSPLPLSFEAQEDSATAPAIAIAAIEPIRLVFTGVPSGAYVGKSPGRRQHRRTLPRDETKLSGPHGDAARERLLDLLVAEADQEGIAALLVTHDEAVAKRMQRLVHLRDGRVGEEDHGSGRRAVISADGSIPIPEHVRARWPAGSLVSVQADRPDALRVSRDDAEDNDTEAV
ncbi:hypothetical protein GCM10009706_11240 [Curtobacterium citreum]|nr:hypothetical protein GCM10009706_11240 [Curtobacterium citreum]